MRVAPRLGVPCNETIGEPALLCRAGDGRDALRAQDFQPILHPCTFLLGAAGDRTQQHEPIDAGRMVQRQRLGDHPTQ